MTARLFFNRTALLVSLAWASPLVAQAPPAGEADPFGEPAPAAAAAEAPPPAPKPAENAPKTPQETDRFVLEIRAAAPKTPAELTRAIQQMLDHGRPDEAKRYLEQLNAARPDMAGLAKLHTQFGSALFFEIQRTPEMSPLGGEFAQAVLEAANAVARDSKRIQVLISQLSSPQPEIRHSARVDLDDARDAALGPLLNVLADEKRQAEHVGVRGALHYLAPNIMPALVAALEAPQPRIKIEVMELLASLEVSEATPWLIRPWLDPKSPADVKAAAGDALRRIVGATPSLAEARVYLYRRVQNFLAGERPAATDADEMIEVWQWDAAQNNSVANRYPAQLASLAVARRLATDLYQLFPDDLAIRRAYLFGLLESEKLSVGLDRPLPRGEGTAFAVAAALGAGALEDCLVYAMQRERNLAAAVTAEVLGAIGTEELVEGAAGKPRPLVQALRSGDRRLRVAAAEAIAQINPQVPYGGSSLFTDTLAFLVNTGSEPRVLIGHPRLEVSESLVGLLDEIGYAADSANRGSEVLLAAGTRADYIGVLISDMIDRAPVRELVQYLRADARTSHLPIGIMARAENLTRLQEFADAERFVLVFPQPRDGREMQRQLQRLNDMLGVGFVPHEVRLTQASRALATLLMLSREPSRYSFYDLLRYESNIEQAQATTALGIGASELLGYYGTPTAQRYLVSLANQNAMPLASRQAAAKGFAVAVRQHGLLLTRNEILLQYERYNQSASLDRETQRVLASLLDAIEAPSGKSSRRAKSAAPATPPVPMTGSSRP